MYSAEEFLKKNNINKTKLEFQDNNLDKIETLKEYDKLKSKVLKYVLYKKRTEYEIKAKFSKEIDENVLEDIIQDLKDNSYIDDFNYIDRAITEYMNLKSLSIKELKYKLLAKGIKSSIIEDYILQNKEILDEYEEKSALKVVLKKRKVMEDEEIRIYLLKKGYSEENIKKSLQFE